MHWQTTVGRLGLALTVALLAACGSNEPKKDGAGDGNSSPTATSSSNGDVRNGQGRPVTQIPAPVIPNLATVTFDKMAVTLDDKAKLYIGQMGDLARKSKKIVATGYCDKNQIANPADAAVARAVAVRDELVRLGVPPANIQVKFVTKIAKKHAVEILFD